MQLVRRFPYRSDDGRASCFPCGGIPEYQVDITGDGDAARLVFRNDAQHRFKILKLLDDDYLHSELTSLEYEANSKSAPL